jgi:hypothetical protein
MTLRPCTPGQCKREELPDWGIYDNCFPRGIKLSDIDGFAEIGGHFLFVDRKKDTGTPGNFRCGQEVAHQRLARLDGITFITEIIQANNLHIWLTRRGDWNSGWRSLNLNQAQQWMTAWAKRAEGGPKPVGYPGQSAPPPESWLLHTQQPNCFCPIIRH